jgi:hypothetical protein
MVGAAAGTPGTAPTNWAPSTGGATVMTLVGTGTESGIDYIDYRFQGSGAADVFNILYEGTTQIVAADAQTWTSSSFVKLVGGSLTNLALVDRIVFRTAAGAFVTSQDAAFTATSAALGTQRKTNTFTAAGGTIARITNAINAGVPTGAYDITLRIGWPQLELGAFVTSPIRTTTTAATRAADDIKTASFAWFNQPAGTIASEFSKPTTTVQSFGIASIEQDATNYMSMWRFGGSPTVVNGSVQVAGVNQANLNQGTFTDGAGPYKTALAYTLNDFAFSYNGQAPGTDVAGTLAPTPTLMRLGGGPGMFPLNGYLRRVVYWPTRLTNAQLQSVTG